MLYLHIQGKRLYFDTEPSAVVSTTEATLYSVEIIVIMKTDILALRRPLFLAVTVSVGYRFVGCGRLDFTRRAAIQ